MVHTKIVVECFKNDTLAKIGVEKIICHPKIAKKKVDAL
jgi:hypothetical protein